MDWQRIIPGHPAAGGRHGTKEDVKALLTFLQDASGEVQKAAREGKCWDTAEKEVKVPKYESWPGYQNNIPFVLRRYCGLWGRGTSRYHSTVTDWRCRQADCRHLFCGRHGRGTKMQLNCRSERTTMLKVYGRANSINVRRVLWMLDEVGEKYEREDWGRGLRPTDDPEFRRINPVGVVPVVDDGDFRLRERNTIVRYLADKHGRADLFPKDLKERATVESWMDWSSTDFANGMRPVFHGLVVKNPPLPTRSMRASRSGAGR